jgi:two-component system, OmpR family, response regulator
MNEKPRILFIEDTLDTLDLIEYLLREAPFDCQFAPDGETGLTLWQGARALSRPFNLILLDLHLRGGRDGFAVLREIRASGDCVPVIFLTATELDRELARTHGALDVWRKPEIMTANLAEKISGTLKAGEAVLTS